LSSGKKNPFTLSTKSKFGIKINTKTLQNKTSVAKNTIPDNQERTLQSGKVLTTSNMTITIKSNVASNNFSLLGAYSGSNNDNNNTD